MSNIKLLQIELRDFKSFGGTHLIGPFEDFSGIVGPNGSGKSNVLDSLAFVFHLDKNPRSTSYIHSVIGSARSDDCSVKVTIEETNDKGKKKKVTHTYERVFDTDENNSYFIDDSEVSEEDYKKQILEKGFHPLIFVKQAEVDLIARKTPIELTQLFEEISGSKEYAQQYDELRIKSEGAHEAVSMIEKRRRAAASEKRHIFDRQKEAQKFRELANKEEKLQIEKSLFQLYHSDKKIKEMNGNIQRLQSELFNVRNQYDEEEFRLREIENQIKNTKNEIQQNDEEIQKFKQNKRNSKEKYITSEAKKDDLERQLKETKRKLEQTSDSAEKKAEQLAELKQDRERIQAELEELNRIKQPEKEFTEYITLREQTLHSQQFQEISQNLQQAYNEQNSILHDLNELKDQLRSQESSRVKKEDFLNETKNNRDNEKERAKEIKIELENSKGQQKLKETQNNVDCDRLKEMRRKLIGIEKECDELRRVGNVDKRRERFQNALSKMMKMFPGVYGLFSDLVRASNDQYRQAVAAGCGSFKDAVVVEDAKTAIQCTKFLKERSYGTATFLPLKSLKKVETRSHPNVRMLSQYLIPTNSHLGDKLKLAIDYVCGHKAVVNEIKEAVKLSRDQNLIVVTKDGCVVDPRGILSGGTSKNQNERSFTKSLQELEKDQANLEKEIGKLGDEISKRKADLDNLRDEILQLEQKDQSYKGRIDFYEDRIKYTEGEIRTIDRNIKDTKAKIEKQNQSLQTTEENVKEIMLQKDQSYQRYFDGFCKKYNVDIKEFEMRYFQDFQRNAQRNELQAELAQIESRIENLEDNRDAELIEQYESQIKNLEEERNETTNEFELAKQECQEHSDELEELEKRRSELLKTDESHRSERRRQREDCKRYSSQLEQITNEKSNSEHEKDSAQAVITSVFQQLRLTNIKLPKKNNNANEETVIENTPSTFTQQQNDMRDLENIDFKSLKASQRAMSRNEIIEEINRFDRELTEVRNTIQQIRPDLKSDDRYINVEKEFNDIVKEQETLRKTATEAKKEFLEVKAKRKDLFMQLFDSVDQHIDKIYKQLTRVRNQENRSGTAYLALEDTEEPYLGGIKYTAMPPHKRFRDLEQLSGGEKAVASLALVIALQMNTQLPFIIMDEPDASLDKLNLRAAADALNKLSKTTQIVSVSLRDRFFEHCHALIGIYKDKNTQSSGVVTLNLDNFQDQTLEALE